MSSRAPRDCRGISARIGVFPTSPPAFRTPRPVRELSRRHGVPPIAFRTIGAHRAQSGTSPNAPRAFRETPWRISAPLKSRPNPSRPSQSPRALESGPGPTQFQRNIPNVASPRTLFARSGVFAHDIRTLWDIYRSPSKQCGIAHRPIRSVLSPSGVRSRSPRKLPRAIRDLRDIAPSFSAHLSRNLRAAGIRLRASPNSRANFERPGILSGDPHASLSLEIWGILARSAQSAQPAQRSRAIRTCWGITEKSVHRPRTFRTLWNPAHRPAQFPPAIRAVWNRPRDIRTTRHLPEQHGSVSSTARLSGGLRARWDISVRPAHLPRSCRRLWNPTA